MADPEAVTFIPGVPPEKVDQAIREAVRQARLWLQGEGGISICGDPVPGGLLTPSATLSPPPRVSPREVLPDQLPEAWKGGSATDAAAILEALSAKHGVRLPWGAVRGALLAACSARMIVDAEGSPRANIRDVPLEQIRFRLPGAGPDGEDGEGTDRRKATSTPSSALWADAELQIGGIRDLADSIHKIKDAATDAEVRLKYFFRVEVEGEPPSPERLAELNELLEAIDPHLRLL